MQGCSCDVIIFFIIYDETMIIFQYNAALHTKYFHRTTIFYHQPKTHKIDEGDPGIRKKKLFLCLSR